VILSQAGVPSDSGKSVGTAKAGNPARSTGPMPERSLKHSWPTIASCQFPERWRLPGWAEARRTVTCPSRLPRT
jgi:hypothetical protein